MLIHDKEGPESDNRPAKRIIGTSSVVLHFSANGQWADYEFELSYLTYYENAMCFKFNKGPSALSV
jgi:hypothetical protein